jgi:hypothetical protein
MKLNNIFITLIFLFAFLFVTCKPKKNQAEEVVQPKIEYPVVSIEGTTAINILLDNKDTIVYPGYFYAISARVPKGRKLKVKLRNTSEEPYFPELRDRNQNSVDYQYQNMWERYSFTPYKCWKNTGFQFYDTTSNSQTLEAVEDCDNYVEFVFYVCKDVPCCYTTTCNKGNATIEIYEDDAQVPTRIKKIYWSR